MSLSTLPSYRIKQNSWETPRAPDTLLERYSAVRRMTEQLCEPLQTEDYVVQSMEDVSPTKWHIAHTSWFFETFILSETSPYYRSLDDTYAYLFNSYYVAVGQRHCRPKRGLLSRPTVEDVYNYRSHVDEHMVSFLRGLDGEQLEQWGDIVELGLNHEQQHQELMLTDIKHNFSTNPLHPAYKHRKSLQPDSATPMKWVPFPEGVRSIGYTGDDFCFDNETPRHRVFLEPFLLASRPVVNAEFIEFIEDGGYRRPELWLSAGWDAVEREEWDSPLYWQREGKEWKVVTLYGFEAVEPSEPTCHISYYEADAYARWAGARLPTEAEWETAAVNEPIEGNFAESGLFHPVSITEDDNGERITRMYGDVWEWTQSHYSPYPGYSPLAGSIGEYNGKFMANQFVLRGGSCATPVSHIRLTYRNFFHADSSWQFTGFRLAKTGTG